MCVGGRARGSPRARKRAVLSVRVEWSPQCSPPQGTASVASTPFPTPAVGPVTVTRPVLVLDHHCHPCWLLEYGVAVTLTCRCLRCVVGVPLLPMNHHHPHPCWLSSHVVMIPCQYVEAVAMMCVSGGGGHRFRRKVGGGTAYRYQGAPPPDPLTHPHQKIFPQEKNEIYQKGPKLRVGCGYTKFSFWPLTPPPGIGHGRH